LCCITLDFRGNSTVAKLAAHPKFVWVFNANCDGAIIYNDPVEKIICEIVDHSLKRMALL
jgi:hypothetical protein